MNEIEKAITYFEALLERLGNGDSDNAVCATALAALRGQAEREKGCEYCEVLTPDSVTGFALPSIYPDCEFDLVTITHCPMCGKRLEVEHGE